MESDRKWMQRALDLAIRGRGRVEPNPMVGCVIVREDQVIGEGMHERFGEAHAERNALASVRESPAGATAYVTLEPCCHTEKKTPPCVPALIAAGIGRVVGACADPNPAVSGRGFAELRTAGIEVTIDVCQAEAMQLNAAFFAHTLNHRPYVTLKWAQSADGLLAGIGGRTVRISNPVATAQIHAMRGRCDAILVGINTVLHDDPMLTARDVADCRPICRIVLDTHLRLPLTSRLVRSAAEHPVWVFCGADAEQSVRAQTLRAAGVRVLARSINANGRMDLGGLLSACSGFTHLLVEPGPTLAASFLAAGLADRAWVIRSPRAIGEPEAPSAPTLRWPPSGNVKLDDDILTEYLNGQADAFYGLHPSADLILARGIY